MKQKTALRTRLLVVLIAGAVAGTLALPGISLAQTANSTLQGSAPPNAPITARNTATGQVRVTRATAEGRYTMVSLTPGTWTVSAGPGTTPQTIELAVASTSSLNFAKTSSTAAPTQTLGDCVVSCG